MLCAMACRTHSTWELCSMQEQAARAAVPPASQLREQLHLPSPASSCICLPRTPIPTHLACRRCKCWRRAARAGGGARCTVNPMLLSAGCRRSGSPRASMYSLQVQVQGVQVNIRLMVGQQWHPPPCAAMDSKGSSGSSSCGMQERQQRQQPMQDASQAAAAAAAGPPECVLRPVPLQRQHQALKVVVVSAAESSRNTVCDERWEQASSMWAGWRQHHSGRPCNEWPLTWVGADSRTDRLTSILHH